MGNINYLNSTKPFRLKIFDIKLHIIFGKHSLTGLLALLMVLPFTSHAQKQNLNQQTTDSIIEADPVFEFGLIIDETISRSGSEFFDLFYLRWQSNTEEDINIRIQEQPGFFRGNFILVWLDEELVFRQQLPKRYDDIETLVIGAVKQLNRKLLDKLFIQKELEY